MTYLLLALLFAPCAIFIGPRIVGWLVCQIDDALSEYEECVGDEPIGFVEWWLHYRGNQQLERKGGTRET